MTVQFIHLDIHLSCIKPLFNRFVSTSCSEDSWISTDYATENIYVLTITCWNKMAWSVRNFFFWVQTIGPNSCIPKNHKSILMEHMLLINSDYSSQVDFRDHVQFWQLSAIFIVHYCINIFIGSSDRKARNVRFWGQHF